MGEAMAFLPAVELFLSRNVWMATLVPQGSTRGPVLSLWLRWERSG